MKLILPQGTVDFDTLGAMLGAFLLDEDTIALAPQAYTEQCEPLAAQYAHKLPFSPRAKWSHPDGRRWKLPLWSRLALGMDFLQSLQVAKWLKEKRTALDPFYASVILLGVYATANRLDSFSIDDEVHAVMDYLAQQGASETFVQNWLAGIHQMGFTLTRMQRMPLAKVYQARVPAWQHAIQRLVYQHAWEMGMPVYLVGGVTRDLLLQRPGRDMDFIVEGSALLLGRALESNYGGRLVTHAPFGTARWELAEAVPQVTQAFPNLRQKEIQCLPRSIDLISARTEWYPAEGQLPQVRMDGIELDMQRRDFSINTLALRIEEEGYTLLDACEGLPDLDHQRIRALHPRSFIDDPTRLFRAVRYEQRLGFRIEPQTEHWMKPGLAKLPVVSGDRIRNELNLMMAEPNPWQQFNRAEQLGLLQAIHPAWKPLQAKWQKPIQAVLTEDLPEQWNLEGAIDHLSYREFMGYAVLLQAQVEPEIRSIGERLLFSSQQIKQLCLFTAALAQKKALSALTPSTFTFELEKLHPALLYVLLVLWLDDEILREKIIRLHTEWRSVKPILNGNDLQSLGVPAGPLYSRILQEIRAARIDGLIGTEEDEVSWVQKLLQQWGEKP